MLVTGAGGSIGSELCRQIYRFAPAQLVMLDRDESALHAVQLSIEGRALLDVARPGAARHPRPPAPARGCSTRIRPEVVFHAAALKHLPLLERHPAEAVKTNVWATLDLLELPPRRGVERFVNISTDKAADPCSVLGYSKRITERLTSLLLAAPPVGAYLSVRFGNVLGSRGSVLTTFQAQIEPGRPAHRHRPRRHPLLHDRRGGGPARRSRPAPSAAPGEALVLDMGKPVSIAEVARLMAARSAGAIDIEFTGLRPGEKLHEVLLAAGEADLRPAHPLISHVAVPPLRPVARAGHRRHRRRGRRSSARWPPWPTAWAPTPPAPPGRHPAPREQGPTLVGVELD